MNRALSTVVILGALLASSTAFAGDPDVVRLKSGARVQGVVVEDDPQFGVSVLLPSGTKRRIARGQVMSVQYASDAPAPAAAAAAPAKARHHRGDEDDDADQDEGSHETKKGERRSTALMVTGIITMPVGVIAAVTGLALVVVSDKSDTCTRNGGRYGSGSYDSYGCEDSGLKTAGIATVIGGALVASAGLVFTIVGASHKKASDSAIMASPPPRVGVAPQPGGLSVVGTF